MLVAVEVLVHAVREVVVAVQALTLSWIARNSRRRGPVSDFVAARILYYDVTIGVLVSARVLVGPG